MSPTAITTFIGLFDGSPVLMGTVLLPFDTISPIACGNPTATVQEMMMKTCGGVIW